MTAVTVAAAQTVPVAGDVGHNVAEHVRLARAAATAGADVVVFPELSLTGYELDRGAALAFRPDDDRLAPLLELARGSAITLVVGAPVRLGTVLHIGAVILAPDAAPAVYTKRHLGAFPAAALVDSVDGGVPPAEATVFAAGDRDPLVRAGDLTAAVAVCADVGRAEHAARAAGRGAGLYLASMFVIPSELDGELGRLRDRAVRHAMAVVFANFGGPSGGLRAAGRSAVFAPDGRPLAQLPARGPGLVVATRDAAGWRATTAAPA